VTGDRLDQLDYYTLLGVHPDATADQIRAAFHEFALRYHPDRHVGTSEPRLARAAQIYRRGAEAYRVLLNPEARREYDQGLKQGRLRHDSEVQGSGASPRRTSGHVLHVGNARARPFAQKAQQALRQQDWQTAALNLRLALQHDPGNTLLENRLQEVEGQLGKRR
jgi:curved DNA-binding protein CbpA